MSSSLIRFKKHVEYRSKCVDLRRWTPIANDLDACSIAHLKIHENVKSEQLVYDNFARVSARALSKFNCFVHRLINWYLYTLKTYHYGYKSIYLKYLEFQFNISFHRIQLNLEQSIDQTTIDLLTANIIIARIWVFNFVVFNFSSPANLKKTREFTALAKMRISHKFVFIFDFCQLRGVWNV